MRIELDVTKSTEENAAIYYERAKKLKRKMEGMKRTIADMTKKIKSEEEKEELETRLIPRTKSEWFEKFRWMKVDGTLIIGGKDASQNEFLAKKHTDPLDLFFHADLHGAPAVVVKLDGASFSKEDLQEVADFAFSYSSAWKLGHGSGKVYYVSGKQISLTPNSGEARAKGGIIVRGERTFLNATAHIEIGVEVRKDSARLVVGYNLSEPKVEIVPGRTKKTDTAKKARKYFLWKLGSEYKGAVSIDEIVRILPGTCEIAKNEKK